MTSSCYEAARQYLALGLHPIPIEPRGKRPLVEWKQYQDHPPTMEQLQAWWAAWPDANVALVCGRGTVAVDCDSHAAWEAVSPRIPAGTPQVATAKGAHFYLRGTAPDRVKAMPGVDVRGVGYVVAPPSVHESGHVYTWMTQLRKPEEWPELPPSLRQLIEKPQHAAPTPASPSWVTEALAGVGEGGRDQTCTRLAGYLWGKGLPEEVVELLLQQWAERCDPPFEPEQVSKCVASIVKREGGPIGPPSPIAEVVNATLAEIAKPKAQRRPAAATNLGRLDDLLAGGFYPGEYVLLGARPSVGKTAFALQVARRGAKDGRGVLINTREMTKTQLVRRLLSQETGVRLRSLKTGELIELEKKMLMDGAPRLAQLPIWITNAKTPGQLAEAVASFEPGQLSMVVVDYLQLLRADSGIRESRQRVEEVSEGLKDIAVTHDVPMLVLSSLSRPPKDKPGWEPSMGDLRESGELEHDADIILLMHRPDLSQGETLLKVEKNRDGDVGRAYLKFHGDIMQFDEATIA